MSDPRPASQPDAETRLNEAEEQAPSSTGVAPPFRPPLPQKPQLNPSISNLPQTGERFADFELLRQLGQGAFGRVFLARQVSLDRMVALKVSANVGHEARTLARLEHAHIVQVFSEQIDAERGLRL